jgi:hypothetical protein
LRAGSFKKKESGAGPGGQWTAVLGHEEHSAEFPWCGTRLAAALQSTAGLQPNSAGTGNVDRLAPIFFIGLAVSGDNAPGNHHPHSFCAQPASALRTGFSSLVVQNLSPHGEKRADRRGRTERRYNQDRLKNARVTGSGSRRRAHDNRALQADRAIPWHGGLQLAPV